MAIRIGAVLDAMLQAAGIPINGVRIGDERDRATWRAVYAPSATAQDIAAGDALIAGFDPTDPATISAAKDQDANGIDTNLVIQAVGVALWEEIQKCTVINGQTLRTKPQLLARVKTIYRNLL